MTLSDRSFDSRIGFGWERGMPDIGSRLASLSTDARVFAVWTDTRAGTQITRKQDQMRAVAAFSSPARLDGREKWALRVGGVLLALAGLALVAGERIVPLQQIEAKRQDLRPS